MRIGIDVGGTHTDAAIVDGGEVVASYKAVTSTDITSGILEALNAVIANAQNPGYRGKRSNAWHDPVY